MIIVQLQVLNYKSEDFKLFFPHPQYKLRSTSNKLGVLMRSIQNNT